MKPVVVLCVISLAVNASLVGYIVFKPQIVAELPVTGGTASVKDEAGTGLSEETRQLLTETGIGNLEALRDRLRAEGLPEALVRNVVEQRLWDDRNAKMAGADPMKKRPWWQQTRESLPGDDVRLAKLEHRLLNELTSRRLELFPESADAGENLETAFLSQGKRKAVQKLQSDYRELHMRVNADSGGIYASPSIASDYRRLEYLVSEEDKDLRALLTPQEYEEMKLRGDANSSRRKNAALLNLSQAEFRGLVELDKWFEQEEAKMGYSGDPFAPSIPERENPPMKLYDERKRRAGALLGPEKAELYRRAEFGEYDAIERYVARFDMPPSRVNEYFGLSQKAESEMTALFQSSTLSVTERDQALRSLGQIYETSLKKLLGPAAMDSGLELGGLIERFKSPR